MPVITKIEAKSLKGRLFHAGIIVALILGSITMIYPFLIMISGAMRSQMDQTDLAIKPKYFDDDNELNRKFIESKYNFDFALLRQYRRCGDGVDFRNVSLPKKANSKLITEWFDYLSKNEQPDHWQILGGTQHNDPIVSYVYDIYVNRLKKIYNNNLKALCDDLGIPFTTWNELDWPVPKWTSSRYSKMKSKAFDEYIKLMREMPLSYRAPVNLTTLFFVKSIFPRYGDIGVKKYNEAHKVKLNSYSEFFISQKIPPKSQPVLRKEWKDFVFDELNLSFVRSDAADKEYRDYLKKKYETIKNLNRFRAGNEVASFSSITLPKEKDWVVESRRTDYGDFLKSIDVERIHLVGPEFGWHKYIMTKYGSMKNFNTAIDENFAMSNNCAIPLNHIERKFVDENKSDLRWRYATKNFRIVWRGMVSQGTAFSNTFRFVVYALFFALTVQPLAAYALSRFQPKGTWKILFIFVATMAFPPMVTTIPEFLVYKKLHLINTIIGLAIPMSINGYLLFLLKGFFDSLPKHLYEAATIDGASEFRMFWQITMMMSKPILAVVALQTFVGAWASFLMPLIFCPAEEMQVLSVWVQQFQLGSPTSAVFACILIASIPTLVIFMFAQRTIMRGIAVPSEK